MDYPLHWAFLLGYCLGYWWLSRTEPEQPAAMVPADPAAPMVSDLLEEARRITRDAAG